MRLTIIALQTVTRPDDSGRMPPVFMVEPMGPRIWHRGARTALVAGACAALAGCQVWNAWLDALRWKPGAAGGEPLTITPNPAGPAGATPLIPRALVYQITMPVGGFTGNDKVWTQLNEDALDSKTTVLLRQNGLRAATGSVARWPEIAKLLDSTGTSQQPIMVQTDGRTPLTVKTRVNVAEQTVFSVDFNNRTQGRTFERCDNGFRLFISGVRNKPALQVGLEPVVTPWTMQPVQPTMGVAGSDLAAEAAFEDLRMTATLTAEQFLVLAALNPQPGSHSVGALWLSDPEHVPATETVLVFVPVPANTK